MGLPLRLMRRPACICAISYRSTDSPARPLRGVRAASGDSDGNGRASDSGGAGNTASVKAGMKRHHDNAGLAVALNGKRKGGLPPYSRGLQPMTADRVDELARAKERIAELSAANRKLESQVASLSRHKREITLVSRMSDLLQTSTTEAEAYSIISETMTQLFPENSGALFAPGSSRDVLETAMV